jgi:Zn-dependent protease with chaperone function
MTDERGADRAPQGRPRPDKRGALASTLPPRYRRQAWLAVGALAAFMLMYVLLAGWFVRTAWRLSLGSSAGADGVFGWIVALCAGLLAAFMIKGVFFIRRGKPEGLTELRPADQPRLFKFLHQLADQAGAPRPYKVYASARVNAAVFYDLSLLNLLLPSRKNLEIGLGLVNVLSLGELRAVLAHEFGHFGQRSMAVGRWVYIAHQITAQLVARRDKLDAFLDAIARSDPRIAWVAWGLQLVIWAIRSLIDVAFRGVLLMQRALSREMEMQADLVAVSLTGSDALVHALSKTGAADDSWERALGFAMSEKARGAPPRDLFALQQRVAARMAAILDDPLYGRVPALPLVDPAAHRLFKAELTQPPRMWLSHPMNHEREANAKKRYVSAPLDERSAWVLFDEPAPLRERVSAALLDAGDVAPAPPDQTLARLDERFARASLDRRYHGAYLGRAVTRASEQVAGLYGSEAPDVADLARAWPKSLAADVDRLRQLERELEQLRALEAGLVEASGGTIRYRGGDVPRSELPRLVLRVRGERDAAREALDAHERLVRRAHLGAARAVDAARAVSDAAAGSATHESMLRGLLAVVHYAEHGEAVVRDLQAKTGATYRMVVAGGKITQARLQPLFADCNRLHEALARLHAQRAHVSLAPALLARLAEPGWAEALGSFDLPAATSANIQKWIEVIDGWVGKTVNALSALRGAALEELLLAEQALAAHVREGAPVPATTTACLVPTDYPRLLLAHEQAHRVRLTPWQRFLRASGRGPAFLRLVVAGSIVGTVLAVGASIGHSTVVVYDALARPLQVRLGGRQVDVRPGVPVAVEVEPDAMLAVEARTLDGRVLERFEARSGSAFGTQVYNVAAASPLGIETATYGPASPVAPQMLGAPRWIAVRADHLFEDPPRSISSRHGEGGTRRVLRGMAGSDPGGLLSPLAGDLPELRRVALAHARWDDVSGAPLEQWLSAAGPGEQTGEVVGQRLRERPDDVSLRRLEQFLASGAAHDAVCARDRARAQERPDDADRAYVAARCDPDGPPRDAAFVDGHRRWPASGWFAYGAGFADAGNGRWETAIAAFDQARQATPAVREEATLQEARLLRMTGAPLSRLAALRPNSERLAQWLAIEDPSHAFGNEDGPLMRAYAALARGGAATLSAGDGVDPRAVDRWLRLAAASDGAAPELVRRALALPLDRGVDHDTFWFAAALALREHGDVAAVERRLEDDLRALPSERADEARRLWRLLQAAVRSGAPALSEESLRGLDPEARGRVQAAAAVALGARAPAAWRESASRLLFATERPDFDVGAARGRRA